MGQLHGATAGKLIDTARHGFGQLRTVSLAGGEGAAAQPA